MATTAYVVRQLVELVYNHHLVDSAPEIAKYCYHLMLDLNNNARAWERSCLTRVHDNLH